jgi:PhnB protein
LSVGASYISSISPLKKDLGMTVKAVTHLNFRGDARAALAFYQSVFGGEMMVMSYKDAGNVQNPSEAEQVMWGQVAAESGFRVMAYDVPSRMSWDPGEIPFFVSVRGDGRDEIACYWEKLSQGANIIQPLGAAAWSPLYGMLKDRFGVTWVLDVDSNSTAA